MALEGGIFIDILTRLNMASVDRVLKDVKLLMKEAGSESGKAFSESLDSEVAAGARGAFDPLVAASDAAFRQMQIGMADLQRAEAQINELRARNYKSTTDQMIAAQRQLDTAIANSQRLMGEASAANAKYRDSFIGAPVVGERGAPEERKPSTGNNRETAAPRAARGEAAGMAEFAGGAATGAAAEVIAEKGGEGSVQVQDLSREVLSHRIAEHLGAGARGVLRAGGIGSALGLVGMTTYGVRTNARIQENLAQLSALQGESSGNVGLITHAVWNQAVQTGMKTDDISKLYPAVEAATNPLTGGRYRGNEAVSVVDTALKLARVSNIAPETALQGLTTSLFNYKTGPQGASGMANLIAQGLAGFKGSAEDYFEAQHTIEPVAEMAGIKAPEVFGALDIQSQSGQTAQQSAQSTRNLIRSLAAPNSMVSSALQQLGLNPENMSVYLSQNGLAGSLAQVTQQIAKNQFGPNGSVVLSALANKPLMEQQQAQIADLLSPKARQYIESPDFQQSLVSGFKARSIMQKAGNAGLSNTDMPLIEQWLAQQKKIEGASDLLKRNQPLQENLFGAFRQAFGTQDAAQAAIMLGGSQEALQAYQKRESELSGAQNNPNTFEQAFKTSMNTDVEQWRRLGQALGKLSARLSDDLLPVIKTVTEKFTGILDYLDQHKDAEKALIDTMLGLATFWAAQKLKITKAIGNLAKFGYNKFKNRGGGEEGAAGTADETLQSAAETLESAATTLETGAGTFETGASTFETAVATFAEATPIFGEAAPVFGEAVPVFSEAATTFAGAVTPFETGSTSLETAASSMETTATTMETAASQLEGAASALDGAASALDGAAAAGAGERGLPVPGGNPGEEPAPGEEPSKLPKGLPIPGFIPLPSPGSFMSDEDKKWLAQNPHGDLRNLPSLKGQHGLLRGGPPATPPKGPPTPPTPGRALGGMIDQPLLSQPDTGGDSILGMLPNGQPVGLRGGEGILTPEAVQALGGEDAVNSINNNPWSNPFKVATTFYGSFAKGVAKYSPFGKYLKATSQTLDSLEKQKEDADKLQHRQNKQLANNMIDYFQSVYQSTGQSYTRSRSSYGGGSLRAGSPAVMNSIAQAAADMGLDEGQLSDVEWIFSHESGFDPNISNGGGHGAPSNNKAYGLGQFLGHMGDKYGQMGAYSGDPYRESLAAIQYMKDRYGSPAGAKAYWETHHAYAKGGVVGYAGGGTTPDSPDSTSYLPADESREAWWLTQPGWNIHKLWQFTGPRPDMDWPNLDYGSGILSDPHDPIDQRRENSHDYPSGGPIFNGVENASFGFAVGGVVPLAPLSPHPGGPGPTPGPHMGPHPQPAGDRGAQVVPAGPNGPQNLHVVGTNNLPGMPGYGPKKTRSDKGGHHRSRKSSVHGDIPSAGLIPGGTAPEDDRKAAANTSQQLTAEGKGFGVGGGLLGMAEAAASTAANAFAPGSGQGAQMAFQLINRAIGYGGQLVGIGLEGLMETFLPNDSPAADPSRNLFGKIALGIAGAHPSGKNLAGMHAQPLDTKKDLDRGANMAKQQPGIHINGDIHNHTGDHQETFNAINKAVNFANHAGWFAGQ